MQDEIEIYRDESSLDMDSGEAFYYYTVIINGYKYLGWARTDDEAIEDAKHLKTLEEEEGAI